jgi:hypothetical protein
MSFPLDGAAPASLALEPWIAPTHVYRRIGKYDLLKSTLSDDRSLKDTVQFAVQEISGEDLLRADSYREGYFAAYWPSSVLLDPFLNHVDQFLTIFKAEIAAARQSVPVRVHERFREPAHAYLTPPLASAVRRHGLPMDGTEQGLALLRFDTPIADFCFEPHDQRVSIIAAWVQPLVPRLIAATAEFAHQTQPRLSPEVVRAVLDDLPYKDSEPAARPTSP